MGTVGDWETIVACDAMIPVPFILISQLLKKIIPKPFTT
jgi:hypothetical protein